jgi:hypothetical protein
MAKQNIEQTTVLLARTPAVLNALLRDLPEAWVARSESPSSWTVTEVVAHLIGGELTDWLPRIRATLEPGELRTFKPFDRNGQVDATRGKALNELLDEFSHLRTENLRELGALNLQPADMERRALHPALGEVTLSQLLATWATHDLTHLHQISRIMAHQYREAVGPWSAYLGVLKCEGHSS